MKHPFGSFDTRLTMTDSLMDGHLHSPSFASVISLDDMLPVSHGMKEIDLLPEPHLSMPARRPGKRCPRLELDASLDKYHTLDGLTEPLNPQNTPASNSESGSPQDTCHRIRTESLRTSSAPQTSYIDWCPPGSSLNLLDSDSLLNPQPRRCSADDEPRSATPIARMTKPSEAADSHAKKPLIDIISSARCVRFTPPSSPSKHSPYPVERPLPSIERKKHYVASFRQQKQFEKWRIAARAKAQRTSPYRSPQKSAQLAIRLNSQPDICISSANLSSHQIVDSFEHPRHQENTETCLHPDDIITSSASQRQIFDLVAVSLSLNRVRNAVKSSGLGLPGINLQLSYSLRPIGNRLEDENVRNIVSCASTNDLLLYTFFVVPEFVLRVPLAILHFLNRFAHTRPGLAVLVVLRFFWSVSVEFITPVLNKLGKDAILRSGLGVKY